RISRGTRFDRSNRASKKIAAADCGVPALLCADSRVNYRDALAWLYATQRFGIKLGLENIERLLAALPETGDFQIAAGGLEDAVPRKVVHVAGTNGKGSVCAMIEAIARAADYRTGLFTSPHLGSFRERVRVNGGEILEDEVAGGLTEIRGLIGIGIRTRHFLKSRQLWRCNIFKRRAAKFWCWKPGWAGDLMPLTPCNRRSASLLQSISTTRNGSVIPSIKLPRKKQESLSHAFPLS